MSWSLSYANAEEFRDDRPSFMSMAVNADVPPETKEQIAAAREAAFVLLGSKAVGTLDVQINLSGHANTDHEPAQGWANDAITVSIVQKDRKT